MNATGLITVFKIGDPVWLTVEMGMENITVTADGQEPIALSIDESQELGNGLIVASWLLHLTMAKREAGVGGGLGDLLGLANVFDDE
jgi:hypothetical protein